MTTNTTMRDITRTIIRRAMQLRSSVNYSDINKRINLDTDVALLVSPEEWAALVEDPYFTFNISFGNPTGIRICGILVLALTP